MSVFSTENGAKPQSRPAGGECLPFRSRNIRSCLQSSVSPLNLFRGGLSRLGEGRSSIPLSPSLSRQPARPWKEPGPKRSQKVFPVLELFRSLGRKELQSGRLSARGGRDGQATRGADQVVSN